MTKPGPDPVAAHLARAIAFSGKTQREIARAAGLPKPNVLSMMKSGETKIPLERIPSLADACGVDPIFFLSLALRTYFPAVMRAIEDHLGELLSVNEQRLIEVYREGAGEEDMPVSENLLTQLKLQLIHQRKVRPGRR